ncbi:MAG: DUF1134 domain-containing protein [Gammaproteobacteria bacterium]|nr:DUF1134 domain-containing protein [Gammaproteobacteria bacterium]
MKKVSVVFTGILVSLVLALTMSTALMAEEQQGEARHIDFSKETPSATVTLQSKSIRLLLGGSWGSGTLHFQGKEYPFKIKGLSAGGVGYTAVDAVGNVYFLEKVEDFAGKFSTGTIGATAVKGKGAATLENVQGVIMSLKAKSTGLALSLGVSGISIEME